MAVELHLPDLPEVPLSLGIGEAEPHVERRRAPWFARVRDLLSTYLPLLLMVVLALGTWWLVKKTPGAPPAAPSGEVRSEPDSTMTGFAIERFDRAGKLRLRIDGELLHHYPDTGRYEVTHARIRALAPDGAETIAVARRALANGELDELELLGGAEVTTRGGRLAAPLQIRSEYLKAFLKTEIVQTEMPVEVDDGSSRLRAAGLTYEHKKQLLDIQGPLRLVLTRETLDRTP